MSEIIKRIETVLIPLAIEFTPNGSQVRSIVHQWVHAIAFGNNLFGEARGANRDTIINRLRQSRIYIDNESFRELILNNIFLKQEVDENAREFTFIDLFAGVGGMRQGFEKAGGRCVFSSEFEKNAQSTYEENYGEYPFGDITTIDPNDIPQHTVLVGGFPCQPFSHAGRKLGIEDTRGTLFHTIARIIQVKRPLAVLLENVRGLISHDKGYTLKIVLTTLINEGYHCNIPEETIRGEDIKELQRQAKRMVMKSKEFGVPQNRQRIYIVMWRNDLPIVFDYPEPPNTPTTVGQILDTNLNGEYTISDKLWAGHQNRKIKNKKEGKGFGYSIVKDDSPYANTISARYYKDGSEILVYQENSNPRKLTPREAGRLQGFPDEFILNKSKVQAYKQFGNSVTIPVVYAVARNMREQIMDIYF